MARAYRYLDLFPPGASRSLSIRLPEAGREQSESKWVAAREISFAFYAVMRFRATEPLWILFLNFFAARVTFERGSLVPQGQSVEENCIEFSRKRTLIYSISKL